jgi:hypothetical protein
VDKNLSEPEKFSSDGLLGARWGELSPRAETHMTLTNGQPHLRSGFGLEFAAALTRNDRVRLLLFHDFTDGAWGDQQHGQIMWENGGGLKVSFLGDLTLFDLYAFGTDSFIAGWVGTPNGNAATGNILGGGVGLRIFRAFALEPTVHWVWSYDAPFVAPDGSTMRSVFDLGLALSFDTCSFGYCNRGARRQTTEDATCALYTDAKEQVCKKTADRATLCQHARDAMAFSDREPAVLAREAVQKFLEQFATAEPTAKPLVSTHDCLGQWRSCGRRQECLLSQKDETIQTRRAYSPYVVELLAALGCNTDGSVMKGDCTYSCEDAGTKPAMCAPR